VDQLLSIGLTNAAGAAALACVAAVVGWVWRRPDVTHALWLLVLLKLIAPPLWDVPISWQLPEETAALELPVSRQAPELATPEVPLAEVEPAAEIDAPPVPEMPEPAPRAIPWKECAVAIWLTGALLYLGVTALRVARFRHLLTQVAGSSANVQEKSDAVAKKLALTPSPVVSLVDAPISPMVWGFGRRPRLLVPRPLWESLDDDARDLLLAHEMAHLCRRDHWVRALELTVVGLYWWYPVAWWARRCLQETAEICCDSLVVALFPDKAPAYAKALLDSAAFLSRNGAMLPAGASGLGPVPLLRRRLTMVLSQRGPRQLSWVGICALLFIGATVLPLRPGQAQQGAAGSSTGDDPARAVVTSQAGSSGTGQQQASGIGVANMHAPNCVTCHQATVGLTPAGTRGPTTGGGSGQAGFSVGKSQGVVKDLPTTIANQYDTGPAKVGGVKGTGEGGFPGVGGGAGIGMGGGLGGRAAGGGFGTKQLGGMAGPGGGASAIGQGGVAPMGPPGMPGVGGPGKSRADLQGDVEAAEAQHNLALAQLKLSELEVKHAQQRRDASGLGSDNPNSLPFTQALEKAEANVQVQRAVVAQAQTTLNQARRRLFEQSGSGQKGLKVSKSNIPTPQAILVFDKDRWDAKAITRGEKIVRAFQLANRSDRTLTVDLQTSDGAVSVTPRSRKMQAGQSIEIVVSVDSKGLLGMYAFHVFAVAGSDEINPVGPPAVLTITAESLEAAKGVPPARVGQSLERTTQNLEKRLDELKMQIEKMRHDLERAEDERRLRESNDRKKADSERMRKEDELNMLIEKIRSDLKKAEQDRLLKEDDLNKAEYKRKRQEEDRQREEFEKRKSPTDEAIRKTGWLNRIQRDSELVAIGDREFTQESAARAGVESWRG
jgi:beta-lactamase regulating signal transducer with metallopeptidase domain